jgi:hypothetical protein
MPLHFTGFASRYALDHPDEEPVEKPIYERVLKYNPHHDPATGRFSSGGVPMRQGGTEGPPTHDAFGGKIRPAKSSGKELSGLAQDIRESGQRKRFQAANQIVTESAERRAFVTGGGFATRGQLAHGGYMSAGVISHPRTPSGAFSTGVISQPRTPSGALSGDPNFNQGEGDPMLAGSTPYKHAPNPAAISVSNAGRRAQARAMFESSAKTPLNQAISKVPLKQRAAVAREHLGKQRKARLQTFEKGIQAKFRSKYQNLV